MAEHSNIDALINQADQLSQQGNWEGARDFYYQALELEPNDLEVRGHIMQMALGVGDFTEVVNQNMAMAELLAAGGDAEQARFRYTEIINLEKYAREQGLPNQQVQQIQALVAQEKPEIFAKLGIIDLNEGKFEEAVNWLKPSLDLDPSRWDTHMAMGRAFMASGKDKEAIGEFQEVVRLAPNEAAYAYEMLGEVFIRAGRPPQSTVVWFRNAGELFVQRGEFVDAIRTYERILEFEPRNKDVLTRLGEIYSDGNNKEKAAKVYLALANIYREEGLIDKVILFYEKLLDCDPDDDEARSSLIEIYNNVLEKDPANMSVRSRLVESLLHKGMFAEASVHQLELANSCVDRGLLEDATSMVRKLLDVDSDNLEARRMLGDLYHKRQMNTEALQEYQEVVRLYQKSGEAKLALEFQHQLVEMFPEASDLRYQAALNLRNQGDREGAMHELLRLLETNPDDMVAQGYLAEEYVALDRWDNAVECYRIILSKDPGRTDTRKRLIKYFLDSGRIQMALVEIQLLPSDDYERVSYIYKIIEKCLDDNDVAQAESYLDYLPEDDERKVIFRKELIKRYLEEGQLSKADVALPLIPRSDKERNKLITKLMDLYLGSGQLQTAIDLMDRLPSDDSLRLYFQRRLISSYQEGGRFEDAATEIAKLPEGDESRADFMNRQISGLMNVGRLEEAIVEIQKLPDDSPNRISFMGQLIEAFLKAGNIDRAAAEVKKLADAGVVESRYQRRLIQAYLNAGRFDEAERDIMLLESTDPEKRSFLRLLLQKLEANGLLDRLQEVVLNLPDDMSEKQQYLDGIVHSYLTSGDMAQARQEVYRMAEQVSSVGNYQEAERLYSGLLSYHPVDVDIRLRLSHQVALQGKIERAREGMQVLAGRFQRENNATSAADIYSRLLEIDPNNLNARYRLGDIWAQHGQSAQALEQFSLLAKVYQQQSLPEVAQRVLHRILELDPKDIIHRRQLIQLLTRTLRFEEATEHYRLLLGIHLDRGDLEEARVCVREIITLQPLNLELRQKLGEMYLKGGFIEEGQRLMEELASTYKGRGDHENVVKVFRTLSNSFEDNQQWETALEYLERVADEQVEADEWEEAQKHYLYALEQYLLHDRKEHTDPLFVKLIDGFFRHKNVSEGVAMLKGIETSFLEKDRLDLALVLKDRLAGIMERQEEWQQALELVESISGNYLTLGETEQALAYCRRSVDLALNHGMMQHGIDQLFQLATLSLEHRGLDATHPIFEEIKTRCADDLDALERMADMLFNEDLLDEARPVYHDILDKDPSRSETLSRIAIIYAREGRLEEAAGLARQIFAKGLVGRIRDEYAQALGCAPDDANYHIKMGEFYQQMGFLEEAIDEFNIAIRDPAKVLVATSCLSLAFEEKGYRNLAIVLLLKAMDQPGFSDEDLLDLRYNLAIMLNEEGRFKEALQAFQECYAVDIRYRDVADRLEELFNKIDASAQNDNYSYDDDEEGYYGEEL